MQKIKELLKELVSLASEQDAIKAKSIYLKLLRLIKKEVKKNNA